MTDIEEYIMGIKIVEESCITFQNAIVQLTQEYELYDKIYKTNPTMVEKKDLEEFWINIQSISSIVENSLKIIEQAYDCVYSEFLDEQHLAYLSQKLTDHSRNLLQHSKSAGEVYKKLKQSIGIFSNNNIH
jgi:hypothetical protein